MGRSSPPPDARSGHWAWAASHLRFMRTQRGLSQPAVGKILSVSDSTISRLELGQERMGEEQAAILDAAWGTGGIFGLIVHYATRGHDADWHQQHLGIEGKAQILRIYESLAIPGIFQIEEYAGPLILAGRLAAEAGTLVPERLARGAVLDRATPPDVWVILSQNVIDWPVGGRDVQARQLAHLLELGERDNIGIRILPRSAGATPGLDGSFKIMTTEIGDIAYSESPEGGRLVQPASEVRTYMNRYERIGLKALNEVDSLALIRETMEGFQ